MALIIYPTVGYDSFISLEDADLWVTNYSPQAPQWNTITDVEKEVYLRLTCNIILNKIDITLLPTTPECLAFSNIAMALNDVIYGISKTVNPNFGLITKEKVGDLEVNYKQYRENINKPSIYNQQIKSCLITYGAVFSSSSQITLGKS